MSPPKVVIESPYSGDIEANVEYALECMRDSYTKHGEAPIASHLLYTRFPQSGIGAYTYQYNGHVADTDLVARAHGMNCGFAWNEHADYAVVYIDRGITKGMQAGIDASKIPVIYRSLFHKTKLYGLVGRSGAGKDSYADYVKSQCGRSKVTSIGCADALKRGCSALYGIPIGHFHDIGLKEQVVERWGKSPRDICKWVGTEVLRNQVSKTFLTDRLRMELEPLMSDGGNDIVIVTDVRFIEEGKLVLELGGELIYIDADERLGPLPPNAHESEKYVAEIGAWGGTSVIKNNGTFVEFTDNITALHKSFIQ
jgi:hypothetical protein